MVDTTHTRAVRQPESRFLGQLAKWIQLEVVSVLCIFTVTVRDEFLPLQQPYPA